MADIIDFGEEKHKREGPVVPTRQFRVVKHAPLDSPKEFISEIVESNYVTFNNNILMFIQDDHIVKVYNENVWVEFKDLGIVDKEYKEPVQEEMPWPKDPPTNTQH